MIHYPIFITEHRLGFYQKALELVGSGKYNYICTALQCLVILERGVHLKLGSIEHEFVELLPFLPIQEDGPEVRVAVLNECINECHRILDGYKIAV